MKIETNVQADGIITNLNQLAPCVLNVRSKVKAGIIVTCTGDGPENHNQTVARILKIETVIKAGILIGML